MDAMIRIKNHFIPDHRAKHEHLRLGGHASLAAARPRILLTVSHNAEIRK